MPEQIQKIQPYPDPDGKEENYAPSGWFEYKNI